MKIKNKNELWLKNDSDNEVKVADLNVKVGAGKIVNVYKYNPYLTVSQVKRSQENGSLYVKLNSRQLRVVKGKPVTNTTALKNVKESDVPIVRKPKSSVVIEQEQNNPETTGSFDFADYGISDLGAAERVNDGEMVTVQTKDDTNVPDVVANTNTSSQDILKDRVSKESSAYGKSAKAATTGKQPFTVISSDLAPEVDEIGTVIIKKEKARKTSYLDSIRRSEESGTLDDDQKGADRVIENEPTKFDTKVATKTEDGSIIMKLKEKDDS